MPIGVYVHRKNQGFQKGHKSFLTDESKLKISKTMSGEKSPNFKGDLAGYRAIHCWINKYKKKPSSCECCKKIKNRMHWANIDHKYNRKLNDYIYLCPACHGIYDKINKLRKKNV